MAASCIGGRAHLLRALLSLALCGPAAFFPPRAACAAGGAAPAPAAGQGPAFDGSAAFRLVERQCALGPRVPGTPPHAAWLRLARGILDSLGAPAEVRPFRARRPGGADTLDLTNLLVRIRPGVRPRLLIGAHWDSRPFADRDPDPAKRRLPVPGANDGASGVAVLLELARIMKQQPPPLGVDLAFFDGEDLGREAHPEEYCLGSQSMALQWAEPLPDWVVVLDMVGSDNAQIGRESYSQQVSPDLNDLIFSLARTRGYLEFDAGLEVAVEDDHLPWLRLGVQGVDLIGFNDPRWHTREDVPAHVSPRTLGHVGQVMCDLMYGGYLSR